MGTILSLNKLVMRDLNGCVSPAVSFKLPERSHLVIRVESELCKSAVYRALTHSGAIKSGTLDWGTTDVDALPWWFSRDIEYTEDLTAFRVVLMGFSRTLGYMTLSQPDVAARLMKTYRCDHVKDLNFFSLLADERQRVYLCSALCSDVQVVVLNEPLEGLEPVERESLQSLFTDLAHLGTSIIEIVGNVPVHSATHVLTVTEKSAVFETFEKYSARVGGSDETE